jgi:hypothetical protein
MAVATLLRDVADGTIVEPPFARGQGRWRQSNAALYIESLLLGFPVMPLLFVRDAGRLVIVDGLQRLHTLIEFVEGRFGLSGLRQLSGLESKLFHELDQPIQRRLLETHLPAVIASGPDEHTLAIELFRRMNETPSALTEADVRAVSLDGPFYRFARHCADMKLFWDLVDRKSVPDDAERLELVLRFFAFSDRYQQFSHHVAEFIDEYIADMNKSFDKARMMSEFHDTMTYVKERFPYGFSKSADDERVPRVRFEALAVGVNLAMRRGIATHPDLSWLDSPEFRAVTRTEASNSRVRLAARIEFVRDRLMRRH